MNKPNHKTDLSSKWLSGMEDPEGFKAKMIEQRELFKRFYELLDQKVKANDKSQLKKDNYDSPNWDRRQADSIGYSRCLEEIKALLHYTQE